MTPARRGLSLGAEFGRVWIAIVSVLWALSLPLLAQNVILHLRNGDRLTGTIKSEDTNRVVIATTWSDGLVVPLKEILKRDPVPTEAPAPISATNPPVAAPMAAKPLPATPPVKIKPPGHWSGDLQVGLDVLFSEREQQVYTARLKLTYARQRFRNLFDYLFSYGKTDGLLSANRMDGSSKTDFDVLDRFYVYSLVGAGYDEIRLIDRRYDLGPGIGYHLVRLTNFVLNFETGVNYQRQEFSDSSQTELFYHRLAENITWKITPRFSMDEKFEYFPQVGNWGTYRFRFETNLRYLLRNNLSLNLTLIDLYDTRSARSVSRNDLQLRSSVGLKF